VKEKSKKPSESCSSNWEKEPELSLSTLSAVREGREKSGKKESGTNQDGTDSERGPSSRHPLLVRKKKKGKED